MDNSMRCGWANIECNLNVNHYALAIGGVGAHRSRPNSALQQSVEDYRDLTNWIQLNGNTGQAVWTVTL